MRMTTLLAASLALVFTTGAYSQQSTPTLKDA
jgi:hypothetical protein